MPYTSPLVNFSKAFNDIILYSHKRNVYVIYSYFYIKIMVIFTMEK